MGLNVDERVPFAIQRFGRLSFCSCLLSLCALSEILVAATDMWMAFLAPSQSPGSFSTYPSWGCNFAVAELGISLVSSEFAPFTDSTSRCSIASPEA